MLLHGRFPTTSYYKVIYTLQKEEKEPQTVGTKMWGHIGARQERKWGRHSALTKLDSPHSGQCVPSALKEEL